MNSIIDGNKFAEEIEGKLETELEEAPKLAIVLIGNKKASKVFTEKKIEACRRNGFKAELKQFSETVEEDKVLEHIRKLNNSKEVNGILVQLPLPSQIDNNKVFNTLDPEKDVDGLTPENIGRLLRGNERITPCAVSAIVRILKKKEISLKGREITIINNSNLIGKPLAMKLTEEDATVTLCHKSTKSLEEHTKNAEIIITATGKSGLLEKEMISKNTIVIDAGYSYKDGEIESESRKIKDKACTSPVPGGVGPVTVAITLENLMKCYKLQN